MIFYFPSYYFICLTTLRPIFVVHEIYLTSLLLNFRVSGDVEIVSFYLCSYKVNIILFIYILFSFITIYRLSLPRTITTTTTATNISSQNSSHDIQFNMQSLACPPPPPPPVIRSGMPAQTSVHLPVYCHSAEATYGTYR